MSRPMNELIADLRESLQRTAMAHEEVAAFLRRTHDAVPAESLNAPAAIAQQILAACGFVVVHRDQMDVVLHIVRMACEGDHESSEDAEQLERLLGYLKSKRRFLST